MLEFRWFVDSGVAASQWGWNTCVFFFLPGYVSPWATWGLADGRLEAEPERVETHPEDGGWMNKHPVKSVFWLASSFGCQNEAPTPWWFAK